MSLEHKFQVWVKVNNVFPLPYLTTCWKYLKYLPALIKMTHPVYLIDFNKIRHMHMYLRIPYILNSSKTRKYLKSFKLFKSSAKSLGYFFSYSVVTLVMWRPRPGFETRAFNFSLEMKRTKVRSFEKWICGIPF